MANELVVTNTTFQQHPRRLYKWTSPGDRVRNQIDYIDWEKMENNNFSDYQLLVAKLKIKLRRKKRRSVPVRYDTETIPQ